ncbi:MAG: hypothetical protein WAM97_10595 [Acidimicrobiales bacterium]
MANGYFSVPVNGRLEAELIGEHQAEVEIRAVALNGAFVDRIWVHCSNRFTASVLTNAINRQQTNENFFHVHRDTARKISGALATLSYHCENAMPGSGLMSDETPR